MMSVQVQLTPGFSNGNPVRLFEGPYALTLAGAGGRAYDVSRDGQKFLLSKESTGDRSSVPASARLTVVLNWLEELKAKVAEK